MAEVTTVFTRRCANCGSLFMEHHVITLGCPDPGRLTVFRDRRPQ